MKEMHLNSSKTVVRLDLVKGNVSLSRWWLLRTLNGIVFANTPEVEINVETSQHKYLVDILFDKNHQKSNNQYQIIHHHQQLFTYL